jgi:hypothetical protein
MRLRFPRANFLKPSAGADMLLLAVKWCSTNGHAPPVVAKSPEIEQDLLSHIQDGYQLETDSLGGNPILRRLKDNEEVRPLSANRSTIKAMEQRGLISPGKVATR